MIDAFRIPASCDSLLAGLLLAFSGGCGSTLGLQCSALSCPRQDTHCVTHGSSAYVAASVTHPSAFLLVGRGAILSHPVSECLSQGLEFETQSVDVRQRSEPNSPLHNDVDSLIGKLSGNKGSPGWRDDINRKVECSLVSFYVAFSRRLFPSRPSWPRPLRPRSGSSVC